MKTERPASRPASLAGGDLRTRHLEVRRDGAEEALNYGLLNAVVDAAELTAEVARWTGALPAGAPWACAPPSR